jgi:hypothetical protein
MEDIPEDNLKLLQRFVRFSITLVARQKAAELALAKLGLSDEQWKASLTEAYASLKPAFDSRGPVSGRIPRATRRDSKNSLNCRSNSLC